MSSTPLVSFVISFAAGVFSKKPIPKHYLERESRHSEKDFLPSLSALTRQTDPVLDQAGLALHTLETQ